MCKITKVGFIFLFGVFWVVGVVVLLGSLVYASNSGEATFAPCHRKCFWAVGRFWVFFADAYYVKFSSSVDGVNWASPVAVEPLESNLGRLFSLWFDGVYVHLVWYYGGQVRYKRGVPNVDGTISWGGVQYVLGRFFRDELNYDTDAVYLRKVQVSGNIYGLDRWAGATEDWTTEVNIGSYPAGTYFVFTPYTTVTTGQSSLPTTIQLKGWMYEVGAVARKLTCFEGRITARISVRNPTNLAHAGELYARLWVSDNPDMSGAVPLTGWCYASVSFDGTLNQTISVTINLDVNKGVGDAYAFRDKYLYIELAWKVTSPATNARVQVEANIGYSYVYAPQIGGYGGFAFVSVDSYGYPWVGMVLHNGIYIYPYVARGNANDGSWNWRFASVRKLSAVGALTWGIVLPMPLTGGKVLVVYARTGYILSQYWNGSAWGSEVDSGAMPSSGLYISAVTVDGQDVVELVYIEATTYNIKHVRWSPDSWSSIATLVSGASSSSAPVLCLNPSNGELYCFWATKTSGQPSGALANHVYYQKYTPSEGWSSPVDFVDESSEVLTDASCLSCSVKVLNNYVPLEYMTKTASPYNVKFAFLSLLPPVVELVDVVVGLDGYVKGVGKGLVEVGVVGDYMCKDVLGSILDVAGTVDVICRVIEKSVADVGLFLDWKSFDLIDVLVDACSVLDWLPFGVPWVVELVDVCGVGDLLFRGIESVFDVAKIVDLVLSRVGLHDYFLELRDGVWVCDLLPWDRVCTRELVVACGWVLRDYPLSNWELVRNGRIVEFLKGRKRFRVYEFIRFVWFEQMHKQLETGVEAMFSYVSPYIRSFVVFVLRELEKRGFVRLEPRVSARLDELGYPRLWSEVVEVVDVPSVEVVNDITRRRLFDVWVVA